MIYKLYVKQLPTGELYLGRTIHDPYKYKGSGVLWKKYIKKYKYTNNDIKTWVLHETGDFNELKEIGLIYSKVLNIVNDPNWLNLIEESGEGLTNPTKEVRDKLRKGQLGRKRIFTNEHKMNMSLARKGLPMMEHHRISVSITNKLPEEREKRSKTLMGHLVELETKEKISNNIKNLWKNGHYSNRKKRMFYKGKPTRHNVSLVEKK